MKCSLLRRNQTGSRMIRSGQRLHLRSAERRNRLVFRWPGGLETFLLVRLDFDEGRKLKHDRITKNSKRISSNPPLAKRTKGKNKRKYQYWPTLQKKAPLPRDTKLLCKGPSSSEPRPPSATKLAEGPCFFFLSSLALA